jgi:hypothetical protein
MQHFCIRRSKLKRKVLFYAGAGLGECRPLLFQVVHLSELCLKRSLLLLGDAKTTSGFHRMMIAALQKVEPH